MAQPSFVPKEIKMRPFRAAAWRTSRDCRSCYDPYKSPLSEACRERPGSRRPAGWVDSLDRHTSFHSLTPLLMCCRGFVLAIISALTLDCGYASAQLIQPPTAGAVRARSAPFEPQEE